MTTATIFQITGEQFSGTGVVCAEARYATVLRHSAERPDRLHLSPELWRQVEKVLADTIPATVEIPLGPT